MSSLRTRLLVALLGAVLLAGVVASAATYYSALGRMVLAFGVDLEAPSVLQVERDWQKGRS